MSDYTFDPALPGILLLSHGPLCEAILSSARLIAGSCDNVAALPLREDDDVEAYGDKAMVLFKSMPEGSIVLFDLLGGTPFNQLMMKSGGEAFPGLCGMNLPMLLEAVSLREVMNGDELIDTLADSAREAVVNIRSFFEVS